MMSTSSNVHRIFALLPLKKCHAIILFGFLIVLVILQTILYFTPGEMAFMKVALPNSSYFEAFLFTSTNIEKEYRKRFNLVDGDPEKNTECTLDYINSYRVAQDDPCVLDLIRNKFMDAPASHNVPYNLENRNYSGHWANELELKELLNNKRDGFFVECGAYDGEFISNTLNLEMNFNWTGILIEGSPKNYKKLLNKKRKAWTLPMCLSPYPYPTKVLFVDSKDGNNSASLHIIETDKKGDKIYDKLWDKAEGQMNDPTIEIQCFPLYSILLAANRTSIDYLSLDIEGFEIKILKTIPWDRVDIKTMRVEFLKIQPKENLLGEQILTKYMEDEPGYIKFAIRAFDAVYVNPKFFNNSYYAPVRHSLDVLLG